MTNKRFMLNEVGELIDLDTAKFVDYGEEVCELLNKLNDKNKQLKERVNLLSDQITAQGIILEDYQKRDNDLFEKHLIDALDEKNNTNAVLNKLRIELISRMNDCFEEFKE